MNTPIQYPDIGVQNVTPQADPDQTYPMPYVEPAQQSPMPTVNVASDTNPQQTSYDPMTSPPTQEELDAIGYTHEEQHAQADPLTAPPTQAELNAIGYKAPKSPQEQHLDTIENAGNGLLDLITAAGHEVGSLAGGAVKNIGKMTGIKTLENLGQANQTYSDKVVQEARDRSPIAGGIGKYGSDTVAALASAPFATTAKGLLATGALAGGLTSLATGNGDNPALDILKSSAAGAVGNNENYF